LVSSLLPLRPLVEDCLDRPPAPAGASSGSNRISQCLEQVASEQPQVQRHLLGALARQVRLGEDSLEPTNQPASVHLWQLWLLLLEHLQEALELPQVSLAVGGFSAQQLLRLAQTRPEALVQQQANLGECLELLRVNPQLLEQLTPRRGSEDLEHSNLIRI